MTKREESLKRAEDERLSKRISDFLDERLFSKTDNFERVNDKDRQVQGIDIIFVKNNEQYVCDEKTAVRYRNIPTFAFELSFIDRANEVAEGWLTSHRCINNSYCITWVDDGSIEVAIIKKSAIFSLLESYGWTKEKLREKDKRIRNNENEPMGNLWKNGVKFSFTKGLVEQPINILLQRQELLKIADFKEKFNFNTFSL